METLVLAVKASDLKIGYLDEEEKVLWVVKGVSFEVSEGNIFCLVGESGCGKSTTGNAIAGILPPHAVVDGELQILDRLVIGGGKMNYNGVRGRLVSYVPQNPGTGLNPYYTVEDQFYYVLNSLYDWDRKKTSEAAKNYLTLVGLDPERVLDYYPHELSGGMQRRAAIALALSTGARILVADEPTSSIDANLRLQLIKLLTDLRDSQKITLFLITHDIVSAGKICDTIAVMYAGKLVEAGRGFEVVTEPLHPYTSMLVDAAPILGFRKALRSIPGEPPKPGAEVSGCPFRPRCPWASSKCVKHPPSVNVFGKSVECWRYVE